MILLRGMARILAKGSCCRILKALEARSRRITR
jgi:hypothetical protein